MFKGVYVNIKTEKPLVIYVNKNVHVNIIKLATYVTFAIQLIITANIILQKIIVKYVQQPLTANTENTNLDVRNAEGVRYVNLRSVIKWP